MSPLDSLEQDLFIVGSLIERNISQLPPVSELAPDQEDALEELVLEGFRGCVDNGCMTPDQASTDFYLWRRRRLGQSLVTQACTEFRQAP